MQHDNRIKYNLRQCSVLPTISLLSLRFGRLLADAMRATAATGTTYNKMQPPITQVAGAAQVSRNQSPAIK
jgi:hypothetical protein